jgi:regulator of Ty1 transposition protein 109
MPKIKSASSTLTSMTTTERPEESRYYLWPADSRGEVILSEKDYKKATERLLALQFRNEEAAVASTKTWIEEVAVLAGKGLWGRALVGCKAPEAVTNGCAEPVNGTSVTTLGIKRKADTLAESQPATNGSTTTVNTLLVKKKKKIQPQQV